VTTFSGTLETQCFWLSRIGLVNLWHACPKWHVDVFPWHVAFTVVSIFVISLSNQCLYIVKNMYMYKVCK